MADVERQSLKLSELKSMLEDKSMTSSTAKKQELLASVNEQTLKLQELKDRSQVSISLVNCVAHRIYMHI